jgi:hypothetical protein
MRLASVRRAILRTIFFADLVLAIGCDGPVECWAA